jgi:hypothetical protein
MNTVKERFNRQANELEEKLSKKSPSFRRNKNNNKSVRIYIIESRCSWIKLVYLVVVSSCHRASGGLHEFRPGPKNSGISGWANVLDEKSAGRNSVFPVRLPNTNSPTGWIPKISEMILRTWLQYLCLFLLTNQFSPTNSTREFGLSNNKKSF